jgi:hypothetical protein
MNPVSCFQNSLGIFAFGPWEYELKSQWKLALFRFCKTLCKVFCKVLVKALCYVLEAAPFLTKVNLGI